MDLSKDFLILEDYFKTAFAYMFEEDSFEKGIFMLGQAMTELHYLVKKIKPQEQNDTVEDSKEQTQ